MQNLTRNVEFDVFAGALTLVAMKLFVLGDSRQIGILHVERGSRPLIGSQTAEFTLKIQNLSAF